MKAAAMVVMAWVVGTAAQAQERAPTEVVGMQAQAQAQERTPRQRVWAHVLDAVNGTAAASYEWRITPQLSGTLGGGVGFGSTLWKAESGSDTLSLFAGAQLRAGVSWFFTGSAPNGTFVSPRLTFSGGLSRTEMQHFSTPFAHRHLTGAAQLLVGHSQLLWSRVSLQFAAGLGALYGREWFTTEAVGASPGGTEVVSLRRVAPAFEVAVGYAF